jgi:DNA-binding CsgD family transcriptional regulator
VQTSHAGFGQAESGYLSRVTIAVIGMGPFWTQQTCGLIESEFDTACLRLDSLDAAMALAPGLSGLRLVIVDQRHAEDLLARPESYFALCPSASVALAYRQPGVALDVHRRYDESLGPMGYLPMSVPFGVWLSSIRLLLHREYFLPSDLRIATDRGATERARPTATAGPGDDRIALLTEREREVLHLASAGDSNKVISRKLSISEHTVKLHMHHVYEKLGVSNRTAAASLLLAVERAAP